MKSSLVSRVERLEARRPARKIGPFRSGYVTRLPEGHTGERHIVVVKSEPVEGSPGHEWCDFEERPGPAPPGSDDGGFTVLLTR
jgi:hypothetical protein